LIVLSQNQMQELDYNTFSFLKRTSLFLMELAGKSCADKIKDILLKKNKYNNIYIICGHGNNGGDGFVIARWLDQLSFNVKIVFVGNINKFSVETMNNYEACINLGISMISIKNIDEINGQDFTDSVCVDAVFGIGFSGLLSDIHSKLFQKINDESYLTISIDLPSGLCANTGSAGINAIKADYTLCIAFLKYGHLIYKGKENCGTIEIIDIGIPKTLINNEYTNVRLVTESDVIYPKRSILSHKGDYGKVAIIAGSEQYTGAAILSARACIKSGAGLVYLFSPSSLKGRYDGTLIEAIKISIPEENGNPNCDELEQLLNTMDCVLIGPGIGISEYSLLLVKTVLKIAIDIPVIMDADALNIVSKNSDLMQTMINANILLTPHLAEFSRLSNHNLNDMIENQLVYLKEFVQQYNIPVLLKSSTSLCAYKERVKIVSKGNDGLSTGGSGDVLAGIISSFVAQNRKSSKDIKENLFHSAYSAAYLMGHTADCLNEIYETAAITPVNIINHIFKKWRT